MALARKSQGYWPAFDSAFLAEIVATLRRKSRLLPTSAGTFSCERFRERTDGVESENLELSFETVQDRPVTVAFHCWDDRWMSLDIRQPAKSGWAFEWEHEGRVGEAGPAAVADLLLESVQLPFATDFDFALRFLNDQWTKIAVMGPAGEVK